MSACQGPSDLTLEEWWPDVQAQVKGEEDIEPELMSTHVLGSYPQKKFTVLGRVLHRRKVSKKLFFFDLRVIPSNSHEGGELSSKSLKLEVIVRFDEVALEVIPTLWRKVHVGDLVRIEGWVEVTFKTAMLFHCLDIESVERYSGQNPFTPEPPQTHRVTSKEPEPGHSQEKVDKLCKYWLNSGKCQLGDACPFLHVTNEDKSLVRMNWVNERIMRRRNQGLAFDPHSPAQKKSSFHRALVFSEWLLKTFGSTYLSSGSGVLDIAGGRGDVSFHLQSIAGVKCTLVDPRERKLSRRQIKVLRKEKIDTETDTDSSLKGTLSDHLRRDFDADFIKTHQTLIQNASILIGMHPDQVTELIAQTAITNDKPFAILPCCVFGHLFPNRLLSDGKPVVQFDDFVTYLAGLSQGVKQDFLNFEGKNMVLWKN